MAGNCVDQNIVIGIFSGVGGALVIGLVIALVVTNVQQRRMKKERDAEM